jgi:hypothetical protein
LLYPGHYEATGGFDEASASLEESRGSRDPGGFRLAGATVASALTLNLSASGGFSVSVTDNGPETSILP